MTAEKMREISIANKDYVFEGIINYMEKVAKEGRTSIMWGKPETDIYKQRLIDLGYKISEIDSSGLDNASVDFYNKHYTISWEA